MVNYRHYNSLFSSIFVSCRAYRSPLTVERAGSPNFHLTDILQNRSKLDVRVMEVRVIEKETPFSLDERWGFTCQGPGNKFLSRWSLDPWHVASPSKEIISLSLLSIGIERDLHTHYTFGHLGFLVYNFFSMMSKGVVSGVKVRRLLADKIS